MKFVKYPDGSKDPCVQFTGTNEAEVVDLIGQEQWDEILKAVPSEVLRNAFVIFNLENQLIRVAREIPEEFELVDDPDVIGVTTLEIEHAESFLLSDVMRGDLLDALPKNLRTLLECTFIQMFQDVNGNLGIGSHTCGDKECREETAKKSAAKMLMEMGKARGQGNEDLSKFKDVVSQFLQNVTKH